MSRRTETERQPWWAPVWSGEVAALVSELAPLGGVEMRR
jgi:hypothetical protein